MKSWNLRRRRSRSGIVLVTVIVLTFVTSVLMVIWVRSAISRHQQSKRRAWELQALWLVEAGLERTAARLAEDQNYQGETWQIGAEELGGQRSAAVQIKIDVVPGSADLRLATVSATYPDTEFQRARRTKQVTLETSRLAKGPAE